MDSMFKRLPKAPRQDLLERLMLFGGFFVSVFALIFAWNGLLIPAWVEGAYAALVGLTWVWVRLTTRWVRAVTWLHIIAVFTITSMITISLGGHYASGGFMFWALISPVAAMVFFSLRAALVMSALYGGLATLIALYGASLRGTPPLPPAVADWFTAANVIGGTGLVLLTLWYFMRLLAKEQRRIEDSHAETMKVQKLESLGTLAGGIAHDFNNIMMSVQGHLRLARESEARNPGGADELLERAERAVGRATNLTGQLLTFARGGAPVRTAASIVDTIRESAEFVLAGQPIRCTQDIASDLWPVDADLTQISQLIQNLVLNAAQAMPRGGNVWISCANVASAALPSGLRDDQRYVTIEVCDDGPGIAPEDQACIFDPYFTTRGEGTGLGLTICYRIVDDHDGRIDVGTAPGGGACFKIYLPAADGSSEVTPASAQATPTGKGRVLVMDDDPDLCYLLTRLVGSLGYEASATGSPFAAVILDLTVKGGMGGAEAVREILAVDPMARVIASSGYVDSPVLAAHRDHGFIGVLRKPYGRVELGDALSACIGDGSGEVPF